MKSTNPIWRQAIVPNTGTIKDAITSLDKSAVKIVLVVDELGALEGTISDGDIRRGLLKSCTLDSPLSMIVHKNALVVPPEMGHDMVMQLMVVNKVQQIPVVDANHFVVGLHRWDEITSPRPRSNVMVIMAGGMGKRLLPHTENCPKPMLLLAGKPMLEHIITRSKAEGFSKFIIAVHYLGHMIEEYFGNGARMGVNISYLRENSPLGTAGALSLLQPRPEESFVVTNGDVITDIRYGELLDFHLRHEALATMAVRLHEWQHPFGVVQTAGVDIVGFEEKPVSRSHINAGVYALDPDALSLLISNNPCDMPTLFERLQQRALRTVAYPMHEPWLDVGRPDDLATARENSGAAG